MGPEYLYPLVDARVGLNERIQQTSTTGQASFSDVPKDEVVRVTASTDFTSVTQQAKVTGNMVWHVPVPLPSAINHDEFMNIIFWDGERNIRWRRGTEIKAYFDYEGAPNMAPADRLAAEAQALREMQAWLDPPGALGPYLRWGGQVYDPDSANVIVYMLHDDAWLERWPDDIDLRVAGRGGPQRFDPDGYIVLGRIWVRVDCCKFQQGLYGHEFGHALGLSHPGDLYADRSIMGYNAIPEPNGLDRYLLQVKMHLPPMITYDPHAATTQAGWDIPEPLPRPHLPEQGTTGFGLGSARLSSCATGARGGAAAQ